MRFPESLPEGGRIGFVAPSFGCATEPYYSAFQNALKKWGEMGYRLDPGPNCYASDGIGISSTPEACGEELTSYFASPDNDCLISCGGGELMCGILDHVDFEHIRNSPPKWFMGYSDNTNMTFLLATLCDTASIYGPCAGAFGMEPWHESLWDAMNILTGRDSEGNRRTDGWSVKNYGGWEKESLKTEERPLAPYHITEPLQLKTYLGGEKTENLPAFEGRLLGGCVDCLITLLGTSYDRVADFQERYREDGIIWFLECCDLNPMDIRRALWQMEHAGWFRGVKGFLIGRPLCGEEEMMGLDAAAAVLGVAGKYGVPVVLDADLGHLAPMMPIVTGSYAEVTAGGNQIRIDMYRK